MVDRLDVVAVGVEHVGAVVAFVVLGSKPRRAVILVVRARRVCSRTLNLASAVAASSKRSRSFAAFAPHNDSRGTRASRNSAAGTRNGKAPPGLKCTPIVKAWPVGSITKNPECAPQTSGPRSFGASSVVRSHLVIAKVDNDLHRIGWKTAFSRVRRIQAVVLPEHLHEIRERRPGYVGVIDHMILHSHST